MAREEDLMKQVEELKRKQREVEEEKEEIRRGRKEATIGGESRRRKEARGGEYMMRESGAGGIASRAMGSAVHMGQLGIDNNNNDRSLYFPNKQQYVRQQHQLLQPHRSSHHASPKWGIGGPFDCGSNATGWYQEESPPPLNSPMGGVYQCKRCGRLGHMAQICTTPQRFEGTCNSCGQYGHRHHNCITNTNNKQQQSQMVVADVNLFSGAGGSAMHVGLQGQEGKHVELQPQMVAADVIFFRVLEGLRCMWDCRGRKACMWNCNHKW